jgi:serine/threonine protein phosphatase PrpC
MRLRLIDSITAPGDPARPNDDAWSATDRFAAVLDGATGLGGKLLGCPSDAAWVAQRGAERLAYHSERLGGDALLHAALSEIEAEFVAGRSRAPTQMYELPMASLMMLQVSGPDAADTRWFGDCSALVRHPGAATSAVGDGLDKRDQERSSVMALAATFGVDPAGALSLPGFLADRRLHRNRYNAGPDGPWIFAPDARCAGRAQTARIALAAGSDILLASDGFTALVTDYGAYDLDGLMKAAVAEGLAALLEELRAIEGADPKGLRFPRFKTSDDATALLLRVEGAAGP